MIPNSYKTVQNIVISLNDSIDNILDMSYKEKIQVRNLRWLHLHINHKVAIELKGKR